MSSANDIQIKGGNKGFVSTLNKRISKDSIIQNDEKIIDNTEITEIKNTKPSKLILILLIAFVVSVIIGVAIAISIVVKKKNKNNEEKGENKENKKKEEEENGKNYGTFIFGTINESNYIKTKEYDDFIIPSDGKLRVVGQNFRHKYSTSIIGKNNKKFIIDGNGKIGGITKNDFPLYYSFSESIINGSYLFKDVKCFKEIDLSKMDSSKIIDASNMFENSNFEEIYFITENESYIANSDYNRTENESYIANSDYNRTENESYIANSDYNRTENESFTVNSDYNRTENENESYIATSDYNRTENESFTANSDYNNEEITEKNQMNVDNNSESGSSNRNLDENLENTQEIIEDSEEGKRKEYFDTTKIKSVNEIFMNCSNLKKIKLPPSFNVGKYAKGMFKGCSKLEEVNTSLISSNEIEEMESMFEDCRSLKDISFSKNFLTGEVKSLINVFKNTNLTILDLSCLRLFSLENYSNIFDGASIKGTLKIGKYYSNNITRNNLLKEIAKVTDSITDVFAPNGTVIDKLFQDIYYDINNITISVKPVDIDYNIHYKKGENYKIYSNYLHIGLGWDYVKNNSYDLDLSILTFDSYLKNLDKAYFKKLKAHEGAIIFNRDDTTGEGDRDDEEITISLDLLPSEVQILTVQLNSYEKNLLKNLKSAYIRFSTETDIIGTYSINQSGNNIGLLIGFFSKNTSNSWYFKPLNKAISGNIVTESVSSIQEILQEYFINEDVYCQNSSKIGNHLHWCGDPLYPPRKGWACPQNRTDKNKCWFCKYGSAVSSYLHFIGDYPNEENIKKCVNYDDDMNWQKFGYKYGETPHDNCFGKIIKNGGETHFVHIMKIYENGKCDIFDPDGGRREGNLNEFNAFIINQYANTTL